MNLRFQYPRFASAAKSRCSETRVSRFLHCKSGAGKERAPVGVEIGIFRSRFASRRSPGYIPVAGFTRGA